MSTPPPLPSKEPIKSGTNVKALPFYQRKPIPVLPPLPPLPSLAPLDHNSEGLLGGLLSGPYGSVTGTEGSKPHPNTGIERILYDPVGLNRQNPQSPHSPTTPRATNTPHSPYTPHTPHTPSTPNSSHSPRSPHTPHTPLSPNYQITRELPLSSLTIKTVSSSNSLGQSSSYLSSQPLNLPGQHNVPNEQAVHSVNNIKPFKLKPQPVLSKNKTKHSECESNLIIGSGQSRSTLKASPSNRQDSSSADQDYHISSSTGTIASYQTGPAIGTSTAFSQSNIINSIGYSYRSFSGDSSPASSSSDGNNNIFITPPPSASATSFLSSGTSSTKAFGLRELLETNHNNIDQNDALTLLTNPLKPRMASANPLFRPGQKAVSEPFPLAPSQNQTGAKFLTSISTTVKNLSVNGLLSPQSPPPLTHTASAPAKFYQDSEVRSKLSLLKHSPEKFDEIIEFGFPIVLQEHQLRAGNPSGHANNNTLYNFTEGPGSSEEDFNTASSSEDDHMSPDGQWQIPSLERIRETLSETGTLTTQASSGSPISRNIASSNHPLVVVGLSAPISGVPREMTLKFTLTPASMRADEEIIYGWQKDLIDTGTLKSGSFENIKQQPENIEDPATAEDTSHPDPPPADYIEEETSFIPVGGLGKDASSKKMMQRMFGKLKKPKTSSSVMITSSDIR